MSVTCYSQRLLNPFHGVMNVINQESAEAVTTDGTHREIYVRNEELLRGLDSDRFIQTSDIRYGRWSMESGLKRGPIFPSEDYKRMEEMGAIVYESLMALNAAGVEAMMRRAQPAEAKEETVLST